MLVSVVVPIYNQENYLEKSINSLINQTYKNLDIVLVNDGSTDNSLEILEKYKALDSRINIVNKENGGLVDATISGIENSKGSYVSFVDPDDFVGDKFIQTFMDSFEEDLDFISCGFYFNDNQNFIPFSLKKNGIFEKEYGKDFILDTANLKINNSLFVSRWNKFVKKEILSLILRDFNKCRDITIGEDSIFTLLLLKYSQKFKTLSEPNEYYYNVSNQNSMMKQFNLSRIDSVKTVYHRLRSLNFNDFLDDIQLDGFYYLQMNFVFYLIKRMSYQEYKILCHKIFEDPEFKTSFYHVIKRNKSLKNLKILLFLLNYKAFYILDRIIAKIKN